MRKCVFPSYFKHHPLDKLTASLILKQLLWSYHSVVRNGQDILSPLYIYQNQATFHRFRLWYSLFARFIHLKKAKKMQIKVLNFAPLYSKMLITYEVIENCLRAKQH